MAKKVVVKKVKKIDDTDKNIGMESNNDPIIVITTPPIEEVISTPPPISTIFNPI